MSVAPGGGAFTLNVYGANFVSGSVVNWNYQPRSTTFVSPHELQAQILATDIERNTAGYVTVTNPTPGGGSSSSSWAQVEVHAPVSTIVFKSPETYYWGGWLLLPADFNHDSILDLVGQYGASGLVLFYGKTDGAFQFDSVAGYFYDGAMGGTYGDFNGDGLLDLAYVAGSNAGVPSPQMNVMLGESNGRFSLGSQIKGNNLFENVVAGDFNGDGKLDLVISDGLAFHVYLGNGNGTFTLSGSYHHAALNLVTADFNGDGKLDTAGIYNSGSGFTVNVFYGKGDGTLLPTPQTVATVSGRGPCSVNFLQVSDFNGDGNPDRAFCTNSQIGIILNNGKGRFQPPIMLDAGTNDQFTFACGDINDDGNIDLLVSQFSVYGDPVFLTFLGNGDGTFQSSQTIAMPTPFAAELGLTVGDFGSRGTLDLASPSNYNMYIYTQ